MTQAITELWNSRAALGQTAGTQDLIAKELEHRAILTAVKGITPHTVLEVGCGRGELARLIVNEMHGIDYLAVDNSREMIAAAKAQPRNARLRYACRGVEDLPRGFFDCVITERMIINLPTWEAQKAAIAEITACLHPGGYYLMCENSQQGLEAINAARFCIGLEAIQRPWHNLYLEDSKLAQIDGLKLERCEPFSALYYLLSRVVNAKLSDPPAYDAPVNQLALSLPWSCARGGLAQGRLWIWRKP